MTEVLSQGGTGSQETELRKAFVAAWRSLFAILAFFACLGTSLDVVPGILLLTWVAVNKLVQISIAIRMADLKLKREESQNSASQNHSQKRQRKAGDTDFALDFAPEGLEAADLVSLKSILVRNVSAAQDSLARAQTELMNWETINKNLPETMSEPADNISEPHSCRR